MNLFHAEISYILEVCDYIEQYRPRPTSSDNGADADSIPSNIAPRLNKQMCIEKAVQQTMNRNFR